MTASPKSPENSQIARARCPGVPRCGGCCEEGVEFRTKATAFVQGDPAKMVLCLRGGVKLSVVNESGKEAEVAVLGLGDFFGERWSRRPDLANRHGHRDYADDCTRD